MNLMWFLTLLLIFCLGCLGGWVIEVIYRSKKRKMLINPGFLNGPYLPLYGFGSVILFMVSSIDLQIYWLVPVFALTTTILELLTGLIFTNFFQIELWDYSKEPLNFKGIISLKFSTYWTILSLIFYLLAYPPLRELGDFYQDHIWTSIFLGFFYGVFLTDVYNSFSLALKIRKAVNEFNGRYMVRYRMDMKRLRREMRMYLRENKLANMIEGYFLTFNKMSNPDLLVSFEDQLMSKLDEFNKDIKKRGENIGRKVKKDLRKLERKLQ
jgi:uncharacterized membrane protein